VISPKEVVSLTLVGSDMVFSCAKESDVVNENSRASISGRIIFPQINGNRQFYVFLS
jgi:hypothetical protein